MTRAEKRITDAAQRIRDAVNDGFFVPVSEVESDDTRIEYGGGSYFVVTFDGKPYTVSVTASYLTDEELEELDDAGD